MFALGASYGYQWTAVDTLHGAAPPLEDRHTQFLDAEVSISNDVAMRIGSALIELDLYMTLGWEPFGWMGTGMRWGSSAAASRLTLESLGWRCALTLIITYTECVSRPGTAWTWMSLSPLG